MPRKGITTNEAAEYVGCSSAALRAWHRTGRGPRFYCAGRLIRYNIRELDAWIARNSHSGEEHLDAHRGVPRSLMPVRAGSAAKN